MNKITCNINSQEKVINLSSGYLATDSLSTIEIERVSVVFNYQNIQTETNLLWYGNSIPGTRIIAEPGYYTLTDINNKLKPAGVTLTPRMDGRCVLTTGKNAVFNISTLLGNLVGIDKPRYEKNTTTTLGNKYDINLGLRYIVVRSNLVNTTWNLYDGKMTDALMILPIPNMSLNNTTYNFVCRERIPIIKDSLPELKFTVSDIRGKPIKIGSIMIHALLY